MKSIFFSFVFLFSISVHSQTPFWQSLGGPRGGTVYSLLVNSRGYIFAGAEAEKALRSSDHGQTWITINNGLDFALMKIVISSDDILFAFGGNCVYRSTDNGDNWTQIKKDGPDPTDLYSIPYTDIMLDKNNDIYISGGYWGGDPYNFYNHLFRSTNNGTFWEEIANIPKFSGNRIHGMAINSLGYIYVTGYGTYRSKDHGVSWDSLSSILINNWDNFLSINDNDQIFVASRYSGIMQSTDLGDTWTWINFGTSVSPQCIAFKTQSEIFVGTSGAVIYSSDDGATWKIIYDGMFSSQINAIVVDSTGNVFASTQGDGIYRLTNKQTDWMNVLRSGPALPITDVIATSSGVLFAGTAASGVFRSTDDGIHWNLVTNGMNNGIINCLCRNKADQIYAGTSMGIYSSTNGGEHWYLISPSNYAVDRFLICPNGDIFAGTQYGVYRSTDNGEPWTLSNIKMSGEQCLLIEMDSTSQIYAEIGVTYYVGGGTLWTTNNRTTWSIINNTLPGIPNSIASNKNSDLFAQFGETYFIAGMHQMYRDLGIYRSVNHGETWNPLNNNLTDLRGVVAADGRGRIYFFSGQGVMLYDESAAGWGRINDNPIEVRKLKLDSQGRFIAATTGGVYRSVETTTDVGNESKLFPQKAELSQNYPNPFNPTTKIEFQIIQSEFVSLKVFDMLGREVTTIVNENLQPGTYEKNFDGSKLASGIYLYKLTTGSFAETKKLVIVK